MVVGLSVANDIQPVRGLRLAATHCGIKPASSGDDLVLLEVVPGSSIAVVFTRNRFCAAPVTLARQHLESASAARYLLINSGNANAGTGTQGLKNALATCRALAKAVACGVESVLPFSTGVIGQQLPVAKISRAIPGLLERLHEDNWLAAARGIMTTDTLPKLVSRQCQAGGKIITITGMCKGSGMIRPDMATMLAYVATDAVIPQDALHV